MKGKLGFLNLISFIISVSIYLFSVFLISFFIYKNNQVLNSIKYTKDKNAYIDLFVMDIDDTLNIISSAKEAKDEKKDIQTSKNEIDEEQILKTTHKKVEKLEEKQSNHIKEQKPKIVEDEKSISDLFSQLDKQKLQEAKNEEDMIQSRRKSDKKTNVKKLDSSSKQISKTVGDKDSGKSQRTGVYNKFRGEIDSMLAGIWSSYRALGNYDATFYLIIDKNGKARYEIDELSYNTEFNQKFRDFLVRIEKISFPNTPDGKEYKHKYKMKELLR